MGAYDYQTEIEYPVKVSVVFHDGSVKVFRAKQTYEVGAEGRTVYWKDVIFPSREKWTFYTVPVDAAKEIFEDEIDQNY